MPNYKVCLNTKCEGHWKSNAQKQKRKKKKKVTFITEEINHNVGICIDMYAFIFKDLMFFYKKCLIHLS